MSDSRANSSEIYLWLTAAGLVVLSLNLFWDESKLIWQHLKLAVPILIIQRRIQLPADVPTLDAYTIIITNLVACGIVSLICLAWLSQFTLPVRSFSERGRAFWRLFLHTFLGSWHGPAIVIKEGKPRADEAELSALQAGVVFVDLSSAVVLEQQHGSNDSVRQEIHFDSLPDGDPDFKPYKKNALKEFLKKFGFFSKDPAITIVKTHGPGIVFTESGQKIVGWADLRTQSRSRQDVMACTRDGIDIKTNITAVFTLGKPEDVLRITKSGSRWLVINTTPVSEGALRENPDLRANDQIIELIFDGLSLDDEKEANNAYEAGKYKWLPENKLPTGKDGGSSQFAFEPERVFAAVYSRAREAVNGMLGEWTDLPPRVATEVFRGLLAHENYDDLYLPSEPEKYPLADFRKKFSTIVRNMGVLGYQIVMRKDGRPLADGGILRDGEVLFSEPKRFQNPAILRDRGIKMLSVSFSDLLPVHAVVREQLFENWRAHWQRETQKTLADHELRAARIHNHERSRTQQDMIYSLLKIFKEERFTDEALAIRLYQALEAASVNPSTQRLLPADTVEMLAQLRQWLMPEPGKFENPPGVLENINKPSGDDS